MLAQCVYRQTGFETSRPGRVEVVGDGQTGDLAARSAQTRTYCVRKQLCSGMGVVYVLGRETVHWAGDMHPVFPACLLLGLTG